MIAQPLYFSKGKTTLYTNDYEGNEEDIFIEQVSGKCFESKFSEIFRMSESDEKAHNENPYKYFIEIIGDNVSFSEENSGHEKKLLVKGGFSTKEKKNGRFRLVSGSASHKKGQGNFPHPVIYLGLNRLYPLALSTLDEKNVINLTEAEQKWFEESYSLVLAKAPPSSGLSTSTPKEANKAAYVLHSDEICNYKSVSAGQDNVGQILTAFLSFRRLKEKLGEKYRGGLLLIDELDATLHPVAQASMLKFLCKQSEELSIQIVTTSHSVVVLEKSFHSELRAKITPVHVVQSYKSYTCKINNGKDEMSYHSIYKDLFHSFGIPSKKLTVLVEDTSASSSLLCILGKEIYANIEVSGNDACSGQRVESASCNYLEWLASYRTIYQKLPLLFALDGDQSISKDIKKRSLVLIGGSYPEKVLYNFFLDKYDWDANLLKLDFDGDTCFHGYGSADVEMLHTFKDMETMYKKWYKFMSEPSKLGKGCSKGWKAYKEYYPDEVSKFKKEFVTIANNVLKNASSEYLVTKDFFKECLEAIEREEKCLKEKRQENIPSEVKVVESPAPHLEEKVKRIRKKVKTAGNIPLTPELPGLL